MIKNNLLMTWVSLEACNEKFVKISALQVFWKNCCVDKIDSSILNFTGMWWLKFIMFVLFWLAFYNNIILLNFWKPCMYVSVQTENFSASNGHLVRPFSVDRPLHDFWTLYMIKNNLLMTWVSSEACNEKFVKISALQLF